MQRTSLRRYRTPTKPPEHAHPFVRRLYDAMHRERIGVADTAERAGVAPETLKQWRYKRQPDLDTLEACLNVVGLTLTVVELKRNTQPKEQQR